ncbi:bifunctional 2-C-methyl-D-erythritol 4-phosphate cytidylyltransferase/2-C-methyl-D-erythritol 2,4-cyclodiphosphate synthase [Brevirhabdus pacifica]|uniref:Bifunctional enzyme IspD/IspF n=2 Tax=Brevirhabdus pacifica TaxID=1267768 RepID=A0A1U7DFD4_9RHOB|nr:bifunctional 2-C-methyl-D-erythritol 4-phosphate cytidylyltransferase/2-C-methyl-D-erythritol 2,4-cyclodiphosphate synthase [Brevirhabdus pacifica]APX88603.1 bifunctional 2-C-methyl-D-erythritol 4-phosphate cytidylyltransferase/2-C-methyl-D-erythritol 2,4-cyclodiphosphate synthase [Brevirhabdus pacifica]OWU79887.1 hypothetical protein ATO5_02425 [Loktanella sp. 22II-4b]PJJ86903.1 2-C-methyl-D-erythritol 2,4-cyclodiphosphate synthase [Brevirhabdus pacifica]
MNITAIIVAAGRGLRAGGGLPKQFRPLAGTPVLLRTLAAFADHPRIDALILVTNPDDAETLAALDLEARFPGLRQVHGGADRAASVRAGLEAVETAGVLIHDAARPLVAADLIDRVIDALDSAPGAAPALPVTDALWTGRDDLVSGTRDRAGLFRAQTPQGFATAALRAAHLARAAQTDAPPAADDVEVARAAGLDVRIVAGDETNLKLTTGADFARAAKLLGDRVDIRTGNGFDVHRFGPGDGVILCGVRVDHDRALVGHSDADVGMHAITDAIYGALGAGDIGRHFPPSDPQWRGMASERFLDHAVALAAERGFRLSNADCTLICEHPKIGPHAAAMTKEIARILRIEEDRVSVKATTSERLGFTGREEGIAAMATVTLIAE